MQMGSHTREGNFGFMCTEVWFLYRGVSTSKHAFHCAVERGRHVLYKCWQWGITLAEWIRVDTFARAPSLLLLDAAFRRLINSWPTKKAVQTAVNILLTRSRLMGVLCVLVITEWKSLSPYIQLTQLFHSSILKSWPNLNIGTCGNSA